MRENNNKKTIVIIAAVVLAIVGAVIAALVIKDKPGQGNSATETENTKEAVIKYVAEYGEDLKGKTFTVNTKGEKKESNLDDLEPVIDTMKVGETDHTIEVDKEKYAVIVTVKDTQKPIIEGVQDSIVLKGENIEIEKELTKLITAKDVIDGQVEVAFNIDKDKDSYKVTATAKDKNGNETVEKFDVIVEGKVLSSSSSKDKDDKNNDSAKKDDSKSKDPNNKENTSDSKGNDNKNTNANSSKPGNSGSNNVAQGEKPKPQSPQTKPKPEQKPQPKPEQPKPQPKPEQKPQPKPEQPKPQPKPEQPSNAPPGATLIEENKEFGEKAYSYYKNFSGGGKLTKVVSSPNYISMSGTDNNGVMFLAKYHYSTDSMSYAFDMPALTDQDENILRATIGLFRK